jgi:hypothetical protein
MMKVILVECLQEMLRFCMAASAAHVSVTVKAQAVTALPIGHHLATSNTHGPLAARRRLPAAVGLPAAAGVSFVVVGHGVWFEEDVYVQAVCLWMRDCREDVLFIYSTPRSLNFKSYWK